MHFRYFWTIIFILLFSISLQSSNFLILIASEPTLSAVALIKYHQHVYAINFFKTSFILRTRWHIKCTRSMKGTPIWCLKESQVLVRSFLRCKTCLDLGLIYLPWRLTCLAGLVNDDFSGSKCPGKTCLCGAVPAEAAEKDYVPSPS